MGPTNKTSQKRNSETWWRPTTTTFLGVSFRTYRRRCRDVLMGRRGYVPLWRPGNVPLRHCWVFHLRLFWGVLETYWWDVVATSFWYVVTTFQQYVVETYHWDVLVTFHRDVVGCFIWGVTATLLGRTERRRYASPRRLNAEWGISLEKVVGPKATFASANNYNSSSELTCYT